MEVVWPSGIALQEEVSNQRALRPLTAVRGERHVEKARFSASGVVREDGWKYLSLTRRNPFLVDIETGTGSASRDESGGYPFTAQVVSGVQAA
jgi:hypothetical protein